MATAIGSVLSIAVASFFNCAETAVDSARTSAADVSRIREEHIVDILRWRAGLPPSRFALRRTRKSRPYVLELPDSGLARDRRDQFRRVISDALLEHRLDLTNVADGDRRVAVDYYKIGLLSHCEAADTRVAAEILRA